MNLLLLRQEDIVADGHAIVRGRQHQHILSVKKAAVGDQLPVGLLNQYMGLGEITELTASHTRLGLKLNQPPPTPLPLTLIVALPRPKMVKRILQTCAAMGVKDIVFINSYKVEKSFWQTPLIEPDSVLEQLTLGLEQAMDTVLPNVSWEKRFKPFVEDSLPQLTQGKRALVAHPSSETPCPSPSAEDTLLCIGPEGGFIDYEIDKLQQAGCTGFHLGRRILRTETAVPALLSRLFPIL